MIHGELSRLQIVVLAAGLSSRMGSPKAFARINGISLIRRTIKVLRPFAAKQIIVVTGPRAQRIRSELRGSPIAFAVNPNRTLGLATSVARGLRAGRYSGAALLLPMDLGGLTSRDIQRLISRWLLARRRVTARRIDGRPATPLILPRSLFPRVAEIDGDRGLRYLLAELGAEKTCLVELPSAARDIDTPADLGAARRRARRCI